MADPQIFEFIGQTAQSITALNLTGFPAAVTTVADALEALAAGTAVADLDSGLVAGDPNVLAISAAIWITYYDRPNDDLYQNVSDPSPGTTWRLLT